MSKEILLNKLEKELSYYELVNEMQETINYSKIVDFLDNEKDQRIAELEEHLKIFWKDFYDWLADKGIYFLGENK